MRPNVMLNTIPEAGYIVISKTVMIFEPLNLV